jgi:hypothetical protein
MMRLFLFDLTAQLRSFGVVLGSTLGLLFVGYKLKLSPEIMRLPEVAFLFLFLSGGTNSFRNSSVLKNLPVSKSGFLLAALAMALFNGILIGGAYLTYSILGRTLFPEGDTFQGEVILKALGSLALSGSPHGLLLVFSGMAVFALLLGLNRNWQKNAGFESMPLKLRFLWVGGLFGVGLAAMQVNSAFLGNMLLIGGIWWLAHANIVRELALYPDLKRISRIGVMILVFLQGLLVYGVANRDLQGGDEKRMFSAMQLLGPLALPVSEERLVRIFNETKDPKVVREMIQTSPRILNLVNVEVWLKSRTDPRLLLAIEQKVDPSSWDRSKIEEILLKYDELKLEPRPQFYVKLFRSKIKPDEAKDLLSSTSRHVQAFAVLFCRQSLETTCVPHLLDLLKTLQEQDPFQSALLKESLQTLSVLKAAHVGLDFYADLKADRVKASDWVDPDLNCKDWVQKAGAIQGMDDVARWNHCIRVAARKSPPEHPWRDEAQYWGRAKIEGEKTRLISFFGEYL